MDADDPSRYLTRQAFKSAAQRLATGLHSIGIRKGDCVVIHSRNDIYMPVAAYACYVLGAISCAAPINEPLDRLTELMKIVQPRAIFVELENKQLLQDVCKRIALSGDRLVELDYPGRYPRAAVSPSLQSLLDNNETSYQGFDDLKRSQTTPLMYSFTSGTSGLPKAAIIPHSAIVITAHQREAVVGSPDYDVSTHLVHKPLPPAMHHITPPLLT